MRKIRHFGVLQDGTVIRWSREGILRYVSREWPDHVYVSGTRRFALLGPDILSQITVVLAFSAGEARSKAMPSGAHQ